MALSDVKIRNAKPAEKPYSMYDEKGLFLIVQPSGKKFWQFRYHFLCKQKRIALGPYPLVGLAAAREAKDKMKIGLVNGIDPMEQRKANRLRGAIATENSFEAVARRWHEVRRGTEVHKVRCFRRLEIHVFQKFGKRPIQDITTMDIADCLEEVERKGVLDTAHRVKHLFQQIFRFAVRRGVITHNPAADLRDILAFPKKQHFPCIHPSELPDLLRGMENYKAHGLTMKAMRLLLLTFVRTNELLGARWEEINWDRAEWHVPAERMKMKRPHIVPLARQTLALLCDIQKETGKLGFVFYSATNADKCMSNGAILGALKRMGYRGRMTGHGFRSLASTILNEQNKYNPDAIERQLAHADQNEIRAAYNRADYLLERKAMMQDWADFLDNCLKPQTEKVVYPNFGVQDVQASEARS